VKSAAWITLVLVIATVAGLTGFWFGKHRGNARNEDVVAEESGEEIAPVATVQIAPLREGTIVQNTTAYGSIVAQSGDVRAISVPFETRVTRVLVTMGQDVAAGDELLRLEPSPDALLAQEEAKQALAAADRDLKLVEQRFTDHLATNAEQSQARQLYASAKLKVDTLTQRSAGVAQALKAESDGIVSKVSVQEGQIVAASTSLLEVTSGKQLEAALGVEADVASALKVGQSVDLTPVGASKTEAAQGRIRLITGHVDQSTRLVTVLVTLPNGVHYVLDSYVAGTLTRASIANAMIVPRDAVLPREGGDSVVYTVADGHARAHKVHIGLENATEAQLLDGELKRDDPIVVVGNYVLEDGMDVRVEQGEHRATSTPTASAPTSAEASR